MQFFVSIIRVEWLIVCATVITTVPLLWNGMFWHPCVLVITKNFIKHNSIQYTVLNVDRGGVYVYLRDDDDDAAAVAGIFSCWCL